MDVETSSSPNLPTEKVLTSVHLFNCDRTYKLESVEKLLRDVEANAKCEFSISKHYFPLPKMAETCTELAEYQMDFAVFVVHANESRLSLNEERAGIGYAKIYRALLQATGNRVLIVIGGDEYYEGEEDTQVLSRWAKLKILSQFSSEYLDGRKSFVFSWETKHRLIHEDAVLHFLDPQKQGQIFVPELRSAPEPEQLKTENPEFEEITSKKEKLDPQTDSRKDSSNVIQQSTAQKDMEATTNSASPCTGIKYDQSSQSEQGSKGFEEEQEKFVIVEKLIERNDHDQRHDEVNAGVAETLQSSKTADFQLQIAVLGYKVQQSSFHAAKALVQAVGDTLCLTPSLPGRNGESAQELKMFLDLPELSLINFVILVVEKATVTDKEYESPFLDLLTEIEKYKGRQTVVIVCKDGDWESGQKMLRSPSVEDHARQFEQHVHTDNWIVYSWNEEDGNFNTQSHEVDLVKKALNWFEKHPLQAATKSAAAGNRASAESQNVSPGAAVVNYPTYRPDGELLRMTVRLDHGDIVETMQKFPDNWEPPPELRRGIKKLFPDKGSVKVEIWEDKEGSHIIEQDSITFKFSRFLNKFLKLVSEKKSSV